jgi:hypothetical protein
MYAFSFKFDWAEGEHPEQIVTVVEKDEIAALEKALNILIGANQTRTTLRQMQILNDAIYPGKTQFDTVIDNN